MRLPPIAQPAMWGTHLFLVRTEPAATPGSAPRELITELPKLALSGPPPPKTEPMAVVSAVRQKYGSAHLLQGAYYVGMQHILHSTRGLLRETQAMGLGRERTFLLGKHYSTHERTQQEISQHEAIFCASAPIAAGLPGQRGWSSWSPGIDASTSYLLHAASTMVGTNIGLESKLMAGKRKPRLIIVDDGAEAMESAGKAAVAAGADVAAVEQTRFGARKLHAHPPRFPVVNVAESPVKLHMESVLIGESVAVETDRALKSLGDQGLTVGNRIALIGYGAVGRGSAQSLRERGYQVEVIEVDPARKALAEKEGFTVSALAAALPRADVVLGTTGKAIMTGDDFKALRSGTVLISASSSSVEFGTADGSAVEMGTPNPNAAVSEGDAALHFSNISPFGGTPGTPTAVDGSPLPLTAGGPAEDTFLGKPIALSENAAHRHRVLSLDGKEFLLLNSGSPINLTGEADPIAPSLIQLTRALLLLGTIQAGKALNDKQRADGLIPLDVDGQRFIADRFMHEVRTKNLLPKHALALMEEAYCAALHQLTTAP